MGVVGNDRRAEGDCGWPRPVALLVALGYAGWGEGQLDGELTRHGWLNVPGHLDLLYGCNAESRWEAGFASAGIDSRLLANETGWA